MTKRASTTHHLQALSIARLRERAQRIRQINVKLDDDETLITYFLPLTATDIRTLRDDDTDKFDGTLSILADKLVDSDGKRICTVEELREVPVEDINTIAETIMQVMTGEGKKSAATV